MGGVGLEQFGGFEGGRPPSLDREQLGGTEGGRPASVTRAAVALRRLPVAEAELVLAARPTTSMQAAWHPQYPLAETLEGLTWLFAAWQEMGGLDPASPWWTYQLMVDGQAVGDIGFHGPPDPAGRLTIGYQVVPAAQRRGIATAGCGQLVALAWTAGARGLQAHVGPGNRASCEVLVRNGFHSEDRRTFRIDRP